MPRKSRPADKIRKAKESPRKLAGETLWEQSRSAPSGVEGPAVESEKRRV